MCALLSRCICLTQVRNLSENTLCLRSRCSLIELLRLLFCCMHLFCRVRRKTKRRLSAVHQINISVNRDDMHMLYASFGISDHPTTALLYLNKSSLSRKKSCEQFNVPNFFVSSVFLLSARQISAAMSPLPSVQMKAVLLQFRFHHLCHMTP